MTIGTNTYNYDWLKLDQELMKEFNWFLRKINQRACINFGFIDEKYEAVNRHGKPDPGLGFDVEYFHPTITLDDRMKYIGTVIAQADMSVMNILGNTLISHFYGGRGVHQAITGKDDPNNCFVDFDRIQDGDARYIMELRTHADNAKKRKLPIWGTTELHTSIQGASRNFCREKYGDKNRLFHTIDVCEWVANFRDNGLLQGLLQTDHIKGAYDLLRSQKGIRAYYSFHAAASSSVLPQVKYHHDQRFVDPGPGARFTIQKLWPNAPAKLYAEAVYFLRENSDLVGLTKDVEFHKKAFNFTTKDGKIFQHDQDSLKYYGTEVLCCQFGIYLQIRDDPRACERRKVARADNFGGAAKATPEVEKSPLEQFLS